MNDNKGKFITFMIGIVSAILGTLSATIWNDNTTLNGIYIAIFGFVLLVSLIANLSVK